MLDDSCSDINTAEVTFDVLNKTKKTSSDITPPEMGQYHEVIVENQLI